MKYRSFINENTIIVFTIDDLMMKPLLFSIRQLVIPWLKKGNEPDIHVGYISDGKEYYTGDVIRMEFQNDRQEKIAEEINVVVWNDDIKCIEYAPSPKHRGNTIRELFHGYKGCRYIIYKEILGNIYDGKYQFKEEDKTNCCESQNKIKCTN